MTVLGCASGESLRGNRALPETRLTPAVEHPVDQMVRDRVVFGDALMALFALPRTLENAGYLLEYSGHFCLR